MDTLTERLERLAELQKKNIEPLQKLGGGAFVAFERMARKNYELMGDMVDYSFRQSGLPLKGGDLGETVAAQMAESKAFAELMNQRVAEYADLATTLGGKFRQAGSDAAAAFRTA